MAVILSCSVQNFRKIWRQEKKIWTNEMLRDLSFGPILDRLFILQQAPWLSFRSQWLDAPSIVITFFQNLIVRSCEIVCFHAASKSERRFHSSISLKDMWQFWSDLKISILNLTTQEFVGSLNKICFLWYHLVTLLSHPWKSARTCLKFPNIKVVSCLADLRYTTPFNSVWPLSFSFHIINFYDVKREQRWSHLTKRHCISVTSDCAVSNCIRCNKCKWLQINFPLFPHVVHMCLVLGGGLKATRCTVDSQYIAIQFKVGLDVIRAQANWNFSGQSFELKRQKTPHRGRAMGCLLWNFVRK